MRLAEVAVFAPAPGTFTYAVPPSLAATVEVGTRVWVRFAGRGVEGMVVALGDGEPTRKVSPIARRVDGPSPPPELVELGRWIAHYYLAPPGEAMRLLLPSGGRAREARRVALTEAGVRAADGIGRALDPPELDGVALRERVVLERLRAADGETKVSALSDIDGAKPALKVLEGLGLVRSTSQLSVKRERVLVDLEVTLLREPAPDEPALDRAPRRRALVDHLRSAAAPPMLSELRAPALFGPRAAEHVKALVAAGLAATRERPLADPFEREPVAKSAPLTLNADQASALERLAPAIATFGYAGFLLYGITGSGKTEVYLQAIALALARGRGALVVVPEISLTPQLAARFRARFGDQVAILHSGLGDRERFDAWVRLRDGRMRIALGARSAVFAPVRDLGVVVVDEEHDGSYKQEEGVRYHGRDAAMRRARAAGAVAILGSGTPSLETYHAALEGRIALLTLPARATPRPLPSVEVIDLRQHQPGPDGLLSAPLARAIEETLGANEQAILFLNRRGFSTFVLCKACGHRFTCKDCAVTLTYHQGGERLACHYCGWLEPYPSRCPKCKAQAVARLGMGTERVEAILKTRFPSARVARLDRDVAHGRGLGRILDALRAREIDLLVGTQMVTKGHDFPGVTLVGVVLADLGMGLPDFRATERSFQLLEQVAGRAGRGERPGRVLIQTFRPWETAIERAKDHDFVRFFTDEIAARDELGYPPFRRLGAIRVDGADAAAVKRVAEAVAKRARATMALAPTEARLALLGPAESPLSRLKGRTRWQLLVKAAHPKGVRALLTAAVLGEGEGGVRIHLDVDPVSMM